MFLKNLLTMFKRQYFLASGVLIILTIIAINICLLDSSQGKSNERTISMFRKFVVRSDTDLDHQQRYLTGHYKSPDYRKLVPSQTTYMQAGFIPRKRDRKLDLKVMPTLIKDSAHAFTDYKLAMSYLKTVKHIRNNLDENLVGKKIFELMALENVFPKSVQHFLMFWEKALVPLSPYRSYTLDDVIHDLRLLTERPFPKHPRSNSCNGCYPQDFKFLIEPKLSCKTIGDREIDVVVLVTSVPKAIRERTAVRETWGQWARFNSSEFQLIFLFGGGWSEEDDKELERENKLYGDIFQADFQDHYYNLTYKVLQGYKWVLDNCKGVKYIIRAADDTFLHLPNVYNLLSVYGSKPTFQDYQIGYCLYRIEAPRFPWFKNHLTDNEFRYSHLPPYALGTTFLTSVNLTRAILKAAVNVPFFPIEDIYFGLLLPNIRSGCHHVDGFYPGQGDYKAPIYFGSHAENPKRMYILYDYFMKKSAEGS